MSDHWIAVIPSDPNYVPTVEQAEAALSFLLELAPDSDGVKYSTSVEIRFRDCGANFESVACPFCGALLDEDWWAQCMAADSGGVEGDSSDRGFRLGSFLLPCCGGKAALNDLVYHFEQGFSRFILEAMNPNIGRLDEAHVQRLSDLLGAPVRVIYQHI